MDKLEFNFGEDRFNKLFPFFILIDSSLVVLGIGKSLAKIALSLQISTRFSDHFTVLRPFIKDITYERLLENLNQLIVIELINDGVALRGQFELLDGNLLFVGSPWFVSMEQVVSRNLTMHDFALNDPLIDLLHVLNNQEITTQELNESLVTIKEQKDKLKKDQEKLNRLSIVASANDNGIVFTRANGTIFWCNDAYLKLTGFSNEEVIGSKPTILGNCKHTDPEALKKMATHFYNGEMFDIEIIHGRKDGSYFWTKTKGQPVVDSKGNVTQYFAMVEDITEKKEANFKLIESENRLSFLIRNLQTGILLEDGNRQVVLANKKFCKMYDFLQGPEALVGIDCTKSIPEDKRFFKNQEEYINRFNAVLDTKEPVFDEEIELADGRVFERSYLPLFKKNVYAGNLRYYVDITIKKRYEQSLENEKEKYRRIIANMNLGLIEVDENEIITLANQSFSDISGYGIEELIGQKASELLVSKESINEIKAQNNNRLKGLTDSYELKITNKNGEKRHWLISGAPNYNLHGNVIGSIGIHLDVTEQKLLEERLYLLSLIAEKNINAVVVSNNQGQIEWTNKSFVEMSGYAMEEIIGKKRGSFLQGPETDPETVSYLKERISVGLPFNCEIINYSKSGEKYWVSIQGQALYNKDNQIIRYFAIEEDITARKILENQREELVNSLASSNKELEDYAHIVSHDLKSPLRSIHSLLSWIKEDNEDKLSQETMDYLGMIENKVEKMDHLIEGVLTYAKIDKINVTLEKVNVHEIVSNIIAIIHIPENGVVKIQGQLPIIKGDRFRLQQLFQNLIGNALSHNDKNSALIVVDCKEKEDYYVFSVTDNGPGIAKENQEKIFNTFQSLVNNDKSTGLGLSIVKKIIESYKGKIWIESTLGEGATFYVQLNK